MKKLILILIIALAFVLRFYTITTNPPGLNSDEAAIGYNAYSILKTGRDEFGQSFPLSFRSFDDYKPPLYIYLTVPSVAIFGVNEFAVRFPSAILGVGAVVLVFFLTRQLLRRDNVALLAALLLAISPWHLQFTRSAYEAGSLAFFTTLGLLLLLSRRPAGLVLSAVVFGLETYLYQAGRIFVPLFAATAASIVWQRDFKKIIVFLAIFGFVFLPNLQLLLGKTGLVRFQGVSLFSDPRPADQVISYQISDWRRNDNKSVLVFHKESLAYVGPILTNYLAHFRPDFWVTDSGSAKVNYVPQVGLLYFWELPFIFFGLYLLAKRTDKKPFLLVLFWLLLAPIPSATTNVLVPSSIRSATFLPVFSFVVAVGLAEFFRHRRLALLFLPIFLYSFAFYLHMLFVHAPIVHGQDWYFGYKDVVAKSVELAPQYNQIIISTNLDVPHIFWLFFTKYDPAQYQKEGGTVSGGFAEQKNHLGNKYFFRNIDWEKDKKLPKTLFIGRPSDFPVDAMKLAYFSNLDGSPSIVFIDEKR